MFMSVLASTLVPIWLHFGIDLGSNSTKTATKKDIHFLIAFLTDFWTILAPSWDSVFLHVAQNGTKKADFCTDHFREGFWPRKRDATGMGRRQRRPPLS